MFSKLAVVFVATLAVFAVAAPGPRDIDNSCNTGKVQCCNDTFDSHSKEADAVKTLFHADIKPNTKVGLTCTPLSVVGKGTGSSCTQQAVCCSNNEFNGLIAWGCSPINVNL